MDGAMAIAVSGLTADSTWLDAIASNVANARDESALSASASSQPATFQPVTVNMSADASGGVSAQVVPVQPATSATYDPSSRYANAQGLVAAANVDVVTQLADQAAALASYRANIAVFKTATEMTKATLNLVA
jgi:flagellar basal-body rod protein FlgC